MAVIFRAAVLGCLSAFISGHACAQTVKDLLECAAPVGKDADEAALIRAFGAANVTRGDIEGQEAVTEPGAIIFPNDPKRRIEVLWHFTDERRQPRSITIKNGSTWTVAARRGDKARIAVGMQLAQVEAINGRPFLLNGFGWANGGYLYDAKGGALADRRGCRIDVHFSPDEKIERARPSIVGRVSGGRRFSSSDPAMRAAKPTVSTIELSWPQ